MISRNKTAAQCRALYELASDGWTRCEWNTEFGSASLNLADMNALRAGLMTGATSGAERKRWQEAAQWLAEVEADAQQARQAVQAAVELIMQGEVAKARSQIQQAIDLEAKYRTPVVWRPLQAAILGANPSTR